MKRDKFKSILAVVTPVGAAASMLTPFELPIKPSNTIHPAMASRGAHFIDKNNFTPTASKGKRAVRNRNILSSTKPER